MIREQMAVALTSHNLASSFVRETNVDRLLALAFTDRFGSYLWRLKWANDARSYAPALWLLSRRMYRKCEVRSTIRLLCEVVLREWIEDVCTTCGGRGTVDPTPTSVKTPCSVCGGSTLRRHSDLNRMRRMGFSMETYRKWERRFSIAHEKIADADRQALLDVMSQLERNGYKLENLTDAQIRNITVAAFSASDSRITLINGELSRGWV